MDFPITFWIMVVFLSIGFICNVVSFAAPFWNKVDSFHWGLWQMCSETNGCEAVSTEILTDVMLVGRVLISIGFVLHIILILLLVLYKFWRDSIHLLTAACIVAFISLSTLFIGAVLWMSSSNTTFTWCYYLCYASAFVLSSSCGTILYIRRYKRFKDSNLDVTGEN
ncbi:hypothetical protein ACF0H5_002719 [Mactra antiquata]